MKQIKQGLFVFLLTTTAACTSIPAKVPKLIEVSANTVENQATLVVAEWEAAIAAASSSKKMLELVHSYVGTIDQSKLSNEDREKINNFIRGYPYAIKQVNDVLAQSEEPKKTLSNFDSITNAIRFANSYIAKVVDDDARIEGVIESLVNLNKSKTEGETP